MAKLPEVNASELAHCLEMEITITGWRWWNIKKYIGVKIIKLGAWIVGVDSIINKR